MKKEQLLIKKRLQISLRRLVRHQSTPATILNYLGVDKTTFHIRIQKMRQPDMSLDNFGQLWCVDHIVPLRLFDLTKKDDLELAWNINNLMPMYLTHNFEKEHSLEISEQLLSYLPQNEWITKLNEVVRSNKVDFSIYKDLI